MARVTLGRRRLTRRQVLQTGAALGAASLLSSACRRSGRVDRPNVLLVTLDTTRADHLGCYGYARATSPHVDALAGESTLYRRAIAPGTWTLPSHASLFTGKCPASHGARYDTSGSFVLASAIPDRPSMNEYRVNGLLPSETTLAGVLSRAGYRTAGVGGGPWMKKVFGLGTGFESWDDDGIGSIAGRLGADVTTSAIRWLEGVTEPFLLFLNYFDPHAPWTPPPGFAEPFLSAPVAPKARPTPEQRLALYDGEIRYADQQLGEVLTTLKRLGHYDRTWIIVTSDHGELFDEHGLVGHGGVPYQEVLHVPLVSKPPHGDGGLGERTEWVQLTDIMPMVLDRLGLPRPDGMQGGVPPHLGHPIMAESYALAAIEPNGDWRVIIKDDWKLMVNTKGFTRLHDLAADPRESRNLIDEQPERAADLERIMTAYLSTVPRSQNAQPVRAIDPATREALESLGYLR